MSSEPQSTVVAKADNAAPAGDRMDAIYRHQRHIYDFTRKFFLLDRDRLIRALKPAPGQTVLELGCGTGRNLIATARRYPQARVFGVDISMAMLKTAGANVNRAGLDDRIALARDNATTVDPAAIFGVDRFDRVFFSYSLSMIPSWRDALRHGMSLVAPNGSLSVVDFGNQARLPGWFRAPLLWWLAKFHVTPRLDLPAVMADLPVGRATTVQLHGGFSVFGQAVATDR